MRRLRPILVPLLLALAAWMGWALDRQTASPQDAEPPIVYLPPPWLAEAVSLGHETLIADWYWLQGLQYYAEDANRRVYYRDLHRFLDLVVTLDPDFEYAYRFGGTIIPYNRGRWEWQNVPASISLLERGLERFPDNWRMWMQLGFNRGIIGDDLAGAAEAYKGAAGSEGAPWWVPRLVTRLQAATGQLEAARTYALQIRDSTEDPDLKAAMERRLDEITVEEQLRKLDDAISRYRSEYDDDPAAPEELVRRGLLPRLPEDPLGGTYRIEDGQAVSTSLVGGRLRPLE